MKKTLIILIIMIILTGCNNIKNENQIYTTIYPITYITNYLYNDQNNIYSIYPEDTDVKNYKITKKQIKKYSNSGMFIYNGLSDEKNIAKQMVNKNHKLNIIDASDRLKYDYSIEEIWLSPSNYITLAKNIKDRLVEVTTSQEKIKEINANYDQIENELSIMDAKLRNIVTEAKHNNKSTTLIISSDVFKYLENYGFEIISLQDTNTMNETTINTIKANFKNSKYKYILSPQNEANNDFVNSLVNDYDAEIININTMYSLSKDDISKGENYQTLAAAIIDNIRNIILK